ncbi:dehydrogenase with different specificitie [Ustulina deusta]|nr:dehydrogenase with different specificitie [Ustulina deusta]
MSYKSHWRSYHVFATARAVSKILLDLSEHANVTPLFLNVTSLDLVAQAAQAVAANGRRLDGPIRIVQAFANLLIASCSCIVNMSTLPLRTTYLETIRFELFLFGITVVTIMAGIINFYLYNNEASFSLLLSSLYFAESLIDGVIINRKAAVTYRGPHAGSIKFISTWAPQPLSVSASF